MMNKAQADIAYGFTTIVRSDPSYYAYTLMNNALGQYGIGGRLGDNIRERQGMAYYVFSSFDANVVEGPLFVRAGVNPSNVERAIAAIDDEMRRMAADGMTAAGAGRLQAVSDRLDSTHARNEPGHRHVPADGRVLRAGSGSRPPAAGAARRGDARRSERGGAPHARSRARCGRGGRTVPAMSRAPTKAVFFDVDFTLIYPGPKFQGEGYRQFCARHGMAVDPARFAAAVVSASHILDQAQDSVYNHQIFVDYTAHIIGQMGGSGPAVVEVRGRDLPGVGRVPALPPLRRRAARLEGAGRTGLRIGLISNSHRCLESFQSHFELEGLIDVAISSSQHGYMKPHPSIFEAALKLGGRHAAEAVMVGDSLSQDIEGARRVGMRGVLVRRSESIEQRRPQIRGRAGDPEPCWSCRSSCRTCPFSYGSVIGVRFARSPATSCPPAFFSTPRPSLPTFESSECTDEQQVVPCAAGLRIASPRIREMPTPTSAPMVTPPAPAPRPHPPAPQRCGPAAMNGPIPGMPRAPMPISQPRTPPTTAPALAPVAAPSGAFVCASCASDLLPGVSCINTEDVAVSKSSRAQVVDGALQARLVAKQRKGGDISVCH